MVNEPVSSAGNWIEVPAGNPLRCAVATMASIGAWVPGCQVTRWAAVSIPAPTGEMRDGNVGRLLEIQPPLLVRCS